MALATKCPHCQTTFRVVHDQLKLRAGLVRCGHCKEIFNGIEHLLPAAPAETEVEFSTPIVDSPANQPFASTENAPPPPPPLSANTQHYIDAEKSKFDTHAISDAGVSDPAIGDTAINDVALRDAAVTDATVNATVLDDTSAVQADTTIYSHSADEETPSKDPLQRMTLMDFTRELPEGFVSDFNNAENQETQYAEDEDKASFDVEVHDELDAAIEDLQRKPWRKVKKNTKPYTRNPIDIDDEGDGRDAEEDEPGFIKRGRRQQRFGKKLRLFFGIASLLLFIAALAQGVYIFRNQIAGMYPNTKPALIKMCDLLACRIKLPAQIALISIESSELQAVSTEKDVFVLTTLLRNKGGTSQEWPNIELTLNDNDEKPLLRRVFKATDYISKPDDIAQGILPGNERSVKLTFSLSQIKASGYRVYLFYP